MLKVKTVLRFGKLLVGALLIVGLAGPAFAGNVWSWRTDDGSYAFTDDPKRIPAKHKTESRRRSMGKLSRYERFTNVSVETEKPYVERLRARQTDFRSMTTAAPEGAVAGAVRATETGLVYGVPVSGGRGAGSGASVLVPLDQDGSDSQPTTIESIRVNPRNSLASRHWTVVKKGDRIVTVIKGELRQRPLDGPSEDDFDL